MNLFEEATAAIDNFYVLEHLSVNQFFKWLLRFAFKHMFSSCLTGKCFTKLGSEPPSQIPEMNHLAPNEKRTLIRYAKKTPNPKITDALFQCGIK